ncbi:hypothetical protein KBF38_16015 [bacterium]|nr:hypothetical protein [bacterium]
MQHLNVQRVQQVHPSLSSLAAAMANTAAIKQKIEEAAKWVTANFAAIDETRWTQKIEEALGKPDELESLRVIYDEKAITAVSLALTQTINHERLMSSQSALSTAISATLAAHDAIQENSPECWLKPIMQSQCVEAISLHRQPVPDLRRNAQSDAQSSAYRRACGILVQAFTALVNIVLPRGSSSCYSRELVVPGHKFEKHLSRDVDLRAVFKVDFSDDFNASIDSQHPANQKLAILLDQLEIAFTAAKSAECRLRGSHNQDHSNFCKINNGTINERQHAGRMLDFLHEEKYWNYASEQVEAQNERRRLYEGARQELFIALRNLNAIYEQVALTLHAASSEAKGLLAASQQNRSFGVDKMQTMRICMNNCLAADLRLRTLGRELKPLQEVYDNDFSAGAGKQAIEAKFAEMSVQYRKFK